MISQRQQKILDLLIKEYIDRAEPVSSELLKKRSGLSVSPATIRNELQELTELGYIKQPHTSAGRIPTEKGYKFFIEITFSGSADKLPEFILKEIENAREKLNREIELAKELTKELEQMHSMLELSSRIEEEMMFDVLKIIGSSHTTHDKNIDLMKELLDQLEDF